MNKETNKMIRFLNSIGIDNVEDFDMSFDICERHPIKKDLLIMQICKNTPWNYQFLREFQEGLNSITSYKYSLTFSYRTRPDIDNVYNLFFDWYKSIYHIQYPLLVKEDSDNTLIFIFSTEEEKNMYQEVLDLYKAFLSFLSYDEFFITTSIIVNDELNERKEEIEEENLLTDLETLNQEKRLAEERLINQIREEEKQEKMTREFMRRNKKGNYKNINQISEIDKDSGNIEFNGNIFSIETNAFDNKKVTYGINDENNDAIFVLVSNLSNANELTKGQKVKVRGCAYLDTFTQNVMIKGHYIDILPDDEIIVDNSPVKRVELHLHSKMSAMDGVSSMDQYCEYASKLKMNAIAITDHGVVSGYPDAQKAAKKYNMKMLYGVEFYMVNDELEYIKNPANIKLNNANYVVFDLETTGLSCRHNRIIEFAGVRIEKGSIVSRLDILINPEVEIPQKIQNLTHISNDMVKDKPIFKDCKERILDFVKDAILVSHNADFDIPFLNESLLRENNEILTNPVIDTLSLSRYLLPNSRNHRLQTLCKNFDVEYDRKVAHRADYDANVLSEVWFYLLPLLTKDNPNLMHKDLANLKASKDALKHIHPYHLIAFAKNYDGLHDLYRLISLSHIDYLAEVPKIPRKELIKYRKNLIYGSGCFNGEIFEIAAHKNLDSLKEAISFYDYIEIQPLHNYTYLVNKDDFSNLDEIKEILIDIVNAADNVNVKVCATGDVHYCHKNDKIFRDIYIATKGLGRVPHPLNLNPYDEYKKDFVKVVHYENPDQYFLSTDEMLNEMNFLGEEKAYEITVINTNFIADQCDKMTPLPNDHLYTPKIENSENMLRELCYGNAHKLYGNPLPDYIQKRLDTELDGIISNGYSVIYYIAHMIVKKANEDGYLVGSRGSVGSSFAATMADITEVNPLPPHYRCPKCKRLEWTSEEFPNIKSGFDLPNKKCPICGEEMVRDGQNIPFETFLGFKAEKTPDIDLNFPGDYQARAHDYTKVLLGEDNVFRAGTIEKVAEKTAFGYARGYYESLGVDPNKVPRAKIAYLASGCIDVRRTTGQHPGGIVVIPNDHSVYDFTPIQFPANKFDAKWKTTHFDFRSMHDTILKLDLLGHVDPVALKMMADLTHIDIKSIPLNDKNVLSLFSSTSALHMTHNYLNQVTGALAIPEYGTDFVRGMLEATKPKTFADLVIISGLSHGTNVWNGNAETLINKKIATLREVIGCRDDIMTYLISMGIDSSVSFAIMEDVRHGKGVKQEYEIIMRKNNVPQYYIDSCNKIKYLFPKGHATAYVMMAVRVGYFKVYYPLEFYATFFSVRCDQWDLKAMIGGEEAIIKRLDELKLKSKSKIDKLSPKESAILDTLEVAIEMVQRGYKFENISLTKSDATKFVVDYENRALICPFIVIDGLGENAAQSIIEARKEHEFTSKDDLMRRSKLNGTNLNDLEELHVLDSLNEDDQISLFDFNF